MSERDNAGRDLIEYLKNLGEVLKNVLISDADADRSLEDELVRIAAKPDSDGNIPAGRMSLADAALLLKSLGDADKFAQRIKNAQENGTPSREKRKSKNPEQEIPEESTQNLQPEGTRPREREIGED